MNIITLRGKAKQVFEEIRLASVYRGKTTIGDIAGLDPLEQEKQADAWRTLQDQRIAWQDETNRRKE